MTVEITPLFALKDWTFLVIPGVGVLVTALVGGTVALVGRMRRKRLVGSSKEEDLAWDDLLELLQRNRESGKGGRSADDVPSDASLEELLAQLPAHARRRPAPSAEDVEFRTSGGVERRGGARRWGNPTEVQLHGDSWAGYVHGVVINRSTGGLAVLLDREVPGGTVITVRSVEGPGTLPGVEAVVRHCRKAGRNYLIGCEFSEEVPWNVRVWFG